MVANHGDAVSSKGPPPLLTLAMIVKNERTNLERCLTSVADLVDEIVVVDTGSVDGTQDVARRFGATLIQSEWTHDFSAARNLSLAHTHGRWILVLDADEYLETPAKTALRELLAEHTPTSGVPAVAFNLVQKSTSDGGRTGISAHIVRLFPNRSDVRYRWPIHEQIALSLTAAGVSTVDTNIAILHTGYADPALNQSKQRRNLAILDTQIMSGRDVSPLTYFLRAGCYFDLDEVAAALAAYEQTYELARKTNQNDVAEGALVRIADCLLKLKRPAEVLARIPTVPDVSWHPELLTNRAQAELAVDRPDDARRTYEIVLGCADRPRIPATNLPRQKVEALRFLGEYWHARDHPARALSLLRAGAAVKNGLSDFGASDLDQCYKST